MYSDKCLTTYVRDTRINGIHNIYNYVNITKIQNNWNEMNRSLGLDNTRDIKGHLSCLEAFLIALWLVEFDTNEVKMKRSNQSILDYINVNINEFF